MDTPKKPNTTLIAIIVVVILAIVATTVIVVNQQGSTNKQPTVPTNNQNATYKDGTYKATGEYQTPGGTQSISIELKFEGNVIKDSNLTTHATSGNSVEYQGKFASGYKAEVVGKKVDEVSLSRISGSSLTPNGFNAALEQIKQQARG
ncbi:MAG TPA: hypothetical protein VFZ48_03425 [Candidatus Saccharimonadales bacterium]